MGLRGDSAIFQTCLQLHLSSTARLGANFLWPSRIPLKAFTEFEFALLRRETAENCTSRRKHNCHYAITGCLCGNKDLDTKHFKILVSAGLLVSVVSGGVIISQDREQERLLNLLPGLALNLAHDQWLALLGVTTTRATPVLDIIGGLLPGEETTTTTTTAPCGGLLGLGLLSPCEETTTTAAEETTTTSGGEETTTAGETTTTAAPCGGLLGLGLLAEPCTTEAAETTTTAAETTTTTTTTACGGLLGGGLL